MTRADAEKRGWAFELEAGRGRATKDDVEIVVASDDPEPALLANIAEAEGEPDVAGYGLVDQQAVAALAATLAAETDVEGKLRTTASDAIATLAQAHANWASLTAAQKDAALRLNVRVTVALARLTVGRLDSAI